MYSVSLARILMIITVLVLSVTFSQAQDGLLPVVFKSEGSQISFTLRKELLPAISHIGLNVFTPDIKKIHEQLGPADQPLVWAVQEMSRYTEGDTYLYVGVVILKPLKGDPYVLPGQIMQSGKTLQFRLMNERPDNLPGPKPVEFYKSLTEIAPNNGAAWFFYGMAVCETHRDSMGFSPIALMPPPPPPAAPPPAMSVPVKVILPSKEDQARWEEEERQQKVKRDALQKDLKIVQPAFVKAAELAEDCQVKDAAMAYLAAIADEFDSTEQRRQWLFKRIESPCATNEIKAEVYYSLGVQEWSCAYQITGKYANKKAADLFHFRAVTNPADKQQLERCLTKAPEFIEKALAMSPDYVDAMYYKSLIYRERQKVTANPVERKRLGEEAMKISNQATTIMKRTRK